MIRLAFGLFLIALPLIEIALLVRAGQLIGFWPTLGIVIGTGVLGFLVMARQRFTMPSKGLQAIRDGEPPVAPALDGAFMLLAGGLLFSPGLLADAAGLLLLVAPIRRAFARWSVRQIMRNADVHVTVATAEARQQPDPGPGSGPIIEGEFERLGENPPDQNRVQGPRRS